MISRASFFLVVFASGSVTAAACGRFTVGLDAMGEGGSAGAATASGVGGSVYTAGSVGGGPDAGDYVPTQNDSYKYLCGAMQDSCSPGSNDPTKDCAMSAHVDAGGEGNGGGSGGHGGASYGTDAGPPAALSCTIVASANGMANANSNGTADQCLPRGSLPVSAPCNSALDCAPNLGCVKSSAGSVCYPYCCADVEACAKDTYCAPLPMSEANTSLIPVCVPITPCTLLDDSTCPAGETCTIVRSDGTASCEKPGSHHLGEPCPCAAGYTCSSFSQTCAKLCRTGSNADCPGGGVCMGGSSDFPDGIGICGGYPSD